MFSGSRVEGDAEADDDIRVASGSTQIDGDASPGQQVYEHNGSMTGELRSNTAGVAAALPIDDLVDNG